ncbi:MAG TPA: ceramidase domain-containing protein [Pseudaminobacter sp.]|nr:ceramidase domain-containing protein [Pseudaminobacter sp.]
MLDFLMSEIDLYCERTTSAFWAEPINALSNLAFVAAGVWGVREVRRHGAGTFAEVLAWWVVAIGVGSTLFHTYANVLTKWADVLPIAGFTLAYTLMNLRRFLAMSWQKAAPVFILFYAAAGLVTYLVPDWLRVATNGSTGYLPPFMALLFFGALVLAGGNRAGWYNFVAAGIFVISVTFRAIDLRVCDAVPLGTHFLWHTLNGLMLAVLLAAAARYGAQRPLALKIRPPERLSPAV